MQKVDTSDLEEIVVWVTFEPGATLGLLTVEGYYSDGSPSCSVSRTFTVSQNGDTIEVGRNEARPRLPRRHA